MCWCSKSTIPTVIAENDVIVYKIMLSTGFNKYFKSFHFRKVYEVGKKYAEVMETEPNENPDISTMRYSMIIERGFHSYSMEKTSITANDCYLNVICNENGKYISNINYVKAFYTTNCEVVIAKCIIPKGSKYYMNDLGEIVSDHIIVTGEIIPYN